MTPTAERLAAIGRSRPLWIGVAGAAVALAVFGASALLRAPSAAPYSLGATYPVAITREIESEPAISPDGKLVAYVGETPAGNRIFVRQVEGGRANLLTGELDGNHAWPRWSPDQQRIAFQANGAIYIVPALGGSSKRVIEGGVMPSWSLDGNAIVFADQSTPGGIWIRSRTEASDASWRERSSTLPCSRQMANGWPT